MIIFKLIPPEQAHGVILHDSSVSLRAPSLLLSKNNIKKSCFAHTEHSHIMFSYQFFFHSLVQFIIIIIIKKNQNFNFTLFVWFIWVMIPFSHSALCRLNPYFTSRYSVGRQPWSRVRFPRDDISHLFCVVYFSFHVDNCCFYIHSRVFFISGTCFALGFSG